MFSYSWLFIIGMCFIYKPIQITIVDFDNVVFGMCFIYKPIQITIVDFDNVVFYPFLFNFDLSTVWMKYRRFSISKCTAMIGSIGLHSDLAMFS